MTALQPFLYHSWCFFLPHLLQSKRGRVFLGVSWSCHCQNFLGLPLASFAMLLSLCFLAFFVRFLTWFDSLLYSVNFCSDLVSMYLCQHRCFFQIFWIIFYSYGMCCFIPPPFLITLCGINLSRHAFSISVKWFHMSFTFVAVLVFLANSVVANFLMLLQSPFS